jgi:ribonuclease PH
MSREVVNAEGLRMDGRRPGEMRKINVELDVLPFVDGSCRFTMGHTQVLATVVGPCDSKKFRHTKSAEGMFQIASLHYFLSFCYRIPYSLNYFLFSYSSC